jgi:hypothetical protein
VSSKGIQAMAEENTALELQHINVKLLLAIPPDVDLNAVVNVFHSWIQDQVCEELLLDVADYRHVHHGPGIVLIGHEADYSIDNTDGRLGIRYNRKAPIEGSNRERLAQGVRAVLVATQRLQQDTRLHGKCNFNGQEIEILINDRVLAPNTPETRLSLESEFQSLARQLFGSIRYTLIFESDSRRLFGAKIKADQPLPSAALLENLARGNTPSYV